MDLAGSERYTKTGAEGTVAKEAMHINKSLTFLEQVRLLHMHAHINAVAAVLQIQWLAAELSNCHHLLVGPARVLARSYNVTKSIHWLELHPPTADAVILPKCSAQLVLCST